MELLVCRRRILLQGRPKRPRTVPRALQAAPPFPYNKPTVEGESRGSQGLGDWYMRQASGDESQPAHETHRNGTRKRENPGYTTPPYNRKGGRPHTVWDGVACLQAEIPH